MAGRASRPGGRALLWLVAAGAAGCRMVSGPDTWYVDPANGSDDNTGKSWNDPLASLGMALVEADGEGDTIVLAPGAHRAPARIVVPNVTIRGEGGAILVADGEGMRIDAEGVILADLAVTGGQEGEPLVLLLSGASAELRGVTISDTPGTGLLLAGEGVTARFAGGWIARTGGPAVDVREGAHLAVADSRIVGFYEGSTPGYLLAVTDPGSRLALSHAVVQQAYRHCLLAQDGGELEILDSIVGACGVSAGEADGDTMGHYTVVIDDATARARRSFLNGMGPRPSTYMVYGELDQDETVVWNGYPGFARWAERRGMLGFSIDDRPNLPYALAHAAEMEPYGLHLSFMLNVTTDWSLDDAGWAEVAGLAARGHDVGCHAASNARLPQQEPLLIVWEGGADEAYVEVSPGATELSILAWEGGVSTHLLGPLDLADEDSNVLGKVCALIDEVEGFTCRLNDEYGSATAMYVRSDALADGIYPFTPGIERSLLYDMRVPSEGGRKFTYELLEPKARIEAHIPGYELLTFAYPGQEHDDVVRAAMADVGFSLARGSGGYNRSFHQIYEPFDPLQSPISLSVDEVRGPDYDALPLEEQEARVRAFALGWASFAQEIGGMGSLTIHNDLTAQETAWMMDALQDTDLSVLSLRELWELLQEEGALEDGYWRLLPPPERDYDLAAGSPAIDAGDPGEDRETDAAGSPIYGIPDLGPLEHQPGFAFPEDLPTIRGSVRLYEDGRFRRTAAGEGEADLIVAPASGFAALPGDARRAHLLDLAVAAWTDKGREWRIELQEPLDLCQAAGGLTPGALYRVEAAPEGGAAVVLGEGTADGAGRLRFAAGWEGTWDLELIRVEGKPSAGAPALEPCEI